MLDWKLPKGNHLIYCGFSRDNNDVVLILQDLFLAVNSKEINSLTFINKKHAVFIPFSERNITGNHLLPEKNASIKKLRKKKIASEVFKTISCPYRSLTMNDIVRHLSEGNLMICLVDWSLLECIWCDRVVSSCLNPWISF